MYTVTRYLQRSDDVEAAAKGLVDMLRTDVDGSTAALRPKGDGLVDDVCTSPDWPEHRDAILRYLRVGADAIARARDLGFDVHFDTAIDADDRREWIVFSMSVDPELTGALSRAATALVVSFY